MIVQIYFYRSNILGSGSLESWDIMYFWTIFQHSHVILFCHGACQLIVLGGMSRTQWGSTEL